MHTRQIRNPSYSAILPLLCASLVACADDKFSLGDLAEIAVTPERVVFIIDAVPEGGLGTHDIAISNVGTRPLTVRKLEVVPVGSGADTTLPAVVTAYTAAPLPFLVPPAPSLPTTITLRFTRRDDIPRRLELRIHSSDPVRPIAVVKVDVERANSQLIASPSPVSFPPGDPVPATKTLRLLNNGLTPLRIHRASLLAESAFSVAFGTFTVTAGNSPLTIDPPLEIGANTDIATLVHFAPTDGRPYRGRLILYGDGPNTRNGFAVDLIGNDTAPCIDVQPSRIDFGVKAPLSESAITFDVRNCGTETLDIDAMHLTTTADIGVEDLAEVGADWASSPRFRIDFANATPAVATGAGGLSGSLSLAPGATARVPVVYRAGAPGSTPLGATPVPDRGLVVIRSNALAPLRIINVEGSTEGAEEPPFPDIPGCEYAGDSGRLHDVVIKIAGDDVYNAWLDGDPLPPRPGTVWHSVGTYERRLPAGCYTLAIEVWDVGAVLSGLIASVTIDGVARWKTGDNLPEWIVAGPDAPPADWHSLAFEPDPTVWKSPAQCNASATAPWGSMPQAILSDGARWVWWTSDCRTLQRGWFRLTFTVD